jgi:wyosine [tRNA(Phe)-imidazoG37] synthetase (radical SAM superfamily)
MTPEERSHVYGPVPSRRLGASLGVDLVPYKTCDFDCVYCQLGKTTVKTTERKPYVAADIVLEELRLKLNDVSPDFITMSGSGEPTLNSDIGEIIAGVKGMSKVPVAVLTNGSLMDDPDVAGACLSADLVVPSLDAGDEDTFQAVNRPCEGIGLQTIIDGLLSFREKFEGAIWLEVFLLDGMNSNQEQLDKLIDVAGRLGPEKVQLNTVARPPAEPFARRVDPEALEAVRRLIGDNAEIIEYSPGTGDGGGQANREDVLGLVARRPCTLEDVSRALFLHEAEVSKILGELYEEGLLEYRDLEGKKYYSTQ